MEPLQLLADHVAKTAARQRLHQALPDAATLPDRPDRPRPRLRAPRTALAGILRRTADRLEPCPT